MAVWKHPSSERAHAATLIQLSLLHPLSLAHSSKSIATQHVPRPKPTFSSEIAACPIPPG